MFVADCAFLLCTQFYAFARDGALPKFFTKVDKKYKSPINTGEHSSSTIQSVQTHSLTRRYHASSLARRCSSSHPGPSFSWLDRCLCSCHFHCYHWLVSFPSFCPFRVRARANPMKLHSLRTLHILRHAYPARTTLPLDSWPIPPRQVL